MAEDIGFFGVHDPQQVEMLILDVFRPDEDDRPRKAKRKRGLPVYGGWSEAVDDDGPGWAEEDDFVERERPRG